MDPLPLRAHLLEEVLRFDPELPLARAWTPPATWYADPAFDRLDRDAVLRAGWQPVARRQDLATPGRYVSGCTLGMPWVVVHGEDGELRAFHNACRHKGREVVLGCGDAASLDGRLVCGYHAWAYGLDGRLRSAPRMAGVESFERENMGLVPLRHALWGPWVWITLDRDLPEPAEAFPEVHRALVDSGWEDLRFVESVVWELACDWKVYCDNYLDGGYHIPHMHPSLDAQIDLEQYRTELFERSSIQSCPPAGTAVGELGFDAGERIGGGATYAWLFPNLMLNRYGPWLDTNHVLPAGPGRCRVVYEFWLDPRQVDPSSPEVRASIEQSAVTQREDIEICESVQRGLASPGYDRGRYAPSLEHGEHHFHGLLHAAYRAHLEGPAAR